MSPERLFALVGPLQAAALKAAPTMPLIHAHGRRLWAKPAQLGGVARLVPCPERARNVPDRAVNCGHERPGQTGAGMTRCDHATWYHHAVCIAERFPS